MDEGGPLFALSLYTDGPCTERGKANLNHIAGINEIKWMRYVTHPHS